MTSQNLWNVSLFKHFFKVLSLYLETRIRIHICIKVQGRIRIRIKVKSRIRIRNSGYNNALPVSSLHTNSILTNLYVIVLSIQFSVSLDRLWAWLHEISTFYNRRGKFFCAELGEDFSRLWILQIIYNKLKNKATCKVKKILNSNILCCGLVWRTGFWFAFVLHRYGSVSLGCKIQKIWINL